MPLFGKKDKKEKQGPPAGGSPYPTQGGAGYPTQSYGASGAPPPYTPTSQQGAPAGHAYAPPPQYHHPAPQLFPQAGYPGQPNYHPQYPYGAPPVPQFAPGTHVVGHGQFDAGARFNSGATANIPPPPPGCMPNAAQVAQMHGGTAYMSQAKSSFWTGGSDGGMTTHID